MYMEYLGNARLGSLKLSITRIKLEMYLSVSSKLVIDCYTLSMLDNLVGSDHLFEFTSRFHDHHVKIKMFVFEHKFVERSRDRYVWQLILYDQVKFLEYYYYARAFSNVLVKDIVDALFKEASISIRNNIRLSEKVLVFQNNISNMDLLLYMADMYSLFFFYDVGGQTIVISDDKNFCSDVSYQESDLLFVSSSHGYGIKKISVSFRPDLGDRTDSVSLSSSEHSSGNVSLYINQVCSQQVAKSKCKSLSSRLCYSSFSRYILYGKLAFVGSVINNKLVIGFELSDYFGSDDKQSVCVTLSSKDYLPYVNCSSLNNPMIFSGEVCGDEHNPSVGDDGSVSVKIHSMDFTDDYHVSARMMVLFSGKSYGIGTVPRGKQEVLLLSLDPFSAPIIIGCLHNDKYSRPFSSGNDLNKSYFVTETPGKAANTNTDLYNNSLIFDDTDGSEKVALSSRKDMSITVEGNLSIKVKGDINIEVDGNINIECKKSFSIECKESFSLKAKSCSYDINESCTMGIGQKYEVSVKQECSFNITNKLTMKSADRMEETKKYMLSSPSTSFDCKTLNINSTNSSITSSALTINATAGLKMITGNLAAVVGSTVFLLSPVSCLITSPPSVISIGPTVSVVASLTTITPPALPP